MWLFGSIEILTKKKFIVPLTDKENNRSGHAFIPLIKHHDAPRCTHTTHSKCIKATLLTINFYWREDNEEEAGSFLFDEEISFVWIEQGCYL